MTVHSIRLCARANLVDLSQMQPRRAQRIACKINLNTEGDNTKSVMAAKRLLERNDVVALVGPR